MKIIKKISWASIIFSLIEVALGICLIAMPHTALQTFWYFVAGLIVLGGITRIANYMAYGYEPFGFVTGACEIMLGIAFVFLADVFADVRVFAVIIGIVMMISSVFKFQTAIDAKRVAVKNWWIYVLYAVSLFVLSLVLFFNPGFGANLVLIITGVLFLVDAIYDIVTAIIVNTKIGRLKRQLKRFVEPDDGANIVIEPDKVEVKDKKDE